MIEINDVSKIYDGGFQAVNGVNLSIDKGEIFALLGPNGARKTTLISMICSLVNVSKGRIRVGGIDIHDDPKNARKLIGLVPQELTTDMFETVWKTVSFSRGLFGLSANPAYIEEILKSLSLWDKKDNRLMTLSGGMKRRVMIAKALSHEPKVLFLDEPTAGVDVELRKDMWENIRRLRESGVTIILTTHYIEEAEEMADRIGVIRKGELIVVEDKKTLIQKLGKKHLVINLTENITELPDCLKEFDLQINDHCLHYDYDSRKADNDISELFNGLQKAGIKYKDIVTKQSSLEEIFVELVHQDK